MKTEWFILTIFIENEIEKNKDYANKILEVSDSIIVYDLEKEDNNEKN